MDFRGLKSIICLDSRRTLSSIRTPRQANQSSLDLPSLDLTAKLRNSGERPLPQSYYVCEQRHSALITTAGLSPDCVLLAGKEEERLMYQQLQSASQKQVSHHGGSGVATVC